MSYKFFNVRKKDVLVKSAKSVGIDLPVTLKISYFWNFGSCLILYLFLQIMTGLLLSMHYTAEIDKAFSSVDLIMRDMWYGWSARYLHVSGSSAFFLFLFLHMGRGMYYFNLKNLKTWMSGVTIFLMAMGTGFLGYVLPWGQMSYWGATVMTKFLSVIPLVGTKFVTWVWGGYAVNGPTLTRFYSLHFLLPFIMLFLVGMHIVFLHESGSSNPLGLTGEGDKTWFYPYFLIKDLLGFFVVLTLVNYYFMSKFEHFVEYQNFLEGNPLQTPPHMQPEWYFLPAYAVLRSMPSKLGGVMALVLFVLMLYILPFTTSAKNKNSQSKMKQSIFWIWSSNYFFLTWMGACPVEDPYMNLGRLSSALYFLFFVSLW